MAKKNIQFFDFEDGALSAVMDANCPRYDLGPDLSGCPVMYYCEQHALSPLVLKDSALKNYRVVIEGLGVKDMVAIQKICHDCKLHVRQLTRYRSL